MDRVLTQNLKPSIYDATAPVVDDPFPVDPALIFKFRKSPVERGDSAGRGFRTRGFYES